MTAGLQRTGTDAVRKLATGASLAAGLGAPSPGCWTRAALGGCLVELSGEPGAPLLTLALGLVRQVQQQDEPVAWLARTDSTFYPPDAAAGGVDLAALPVIPAGRPAAPPAGRRAACARRRLRDAGNRPGAVHRSAARRADQAGPAGAGPRHAHSVPDGQGRAPAVARVARHGPRPCSAHLPRQQPGARPFRLPGAGAQGQAVRPGWTAEEWCHGPDGLR